MSMTWYHTGRKRKFKYPISTISSSPLHYASSLSAISTACRPPNVIFHQLTSYNSLTHSCNTRISSFKNSNHRQPDKTELNMKTFLPTQTTLHIAASNHSNSLGPWSVACTNVVFHCPSIYYRLGQVQNTSENMSASCEKFTTTHRRHNMQLVRLLTASPA